MLMQKYMLHSFLQAQLHILNYQCFYAAQIHNQYFKGMQIWGKFNGICTLKL